VDDYLLIGKRIQTLRQIFNMREGIKPPETALKPAQRWATRPF
jgi:aldehyde:ferredoxin oxidoreductase